MYEASTWCCRSDRGPPGLYGPHRPGPGPRGLHAVARGAQAHPLGGQVLRGVRSGSGAHAGAAQEGGAAAHLRAGDRPRGHPLLASSAHHGVRPQRRALRAGGPVRLREARRRALRDAGRPARRPRPGLLGRDQ